MKKTQKLIVCGALLAILVIMAAGAQPQLSLDEQNAIVEAVVQTMNPENMKATVIAEVEADLIAKFTAGGYTGLAGALSIKLPETETPKTDTPNTNSLWNPWLVGTPEPEITEEIPAEEKPAESETAEIPAEETLPAVQPTERPIDSGADYWEGAVQQEDGTWRGLHAKQTASYAYTVGEDENGVVKQFHTEYVPNVRFNVDVVFENDGSVIWPARIEMRHVGNVGEYTGHTESVISDRTYDPVKPGDRCGFTISAHGSENLGWTTFYFQLYDADSGSVIEGGQGSFSYLAK